MMFQETDSSFTYGQYNNFSGMPMGTTPPDSNYPHMPVLQSGNAEQHHARWGPSLGSNGISYKSFPNDGMDTTRGINLNSYHGSSEDNTKAPSMIEQALKPGHISWGNGPPHYYYNPIAGSHPTADSKEYAYSYNGSSDDYMKISNMTEKALKHGHISRGNGPPHFYNAKTSMHLTPNSKEYVNSYHGSSDEYVETPNFIGKALKQGHISPETGRPLYYHKYTAGMQHTGDRQELVNSYHGSSEDNMKVNITEKALKEAQINWGNGKSPMIKGRKAINLGSYEEF